MRIFFSLIALAILLLGSCIKQPKKVLALGVWRAQLSLTPSNAPVSERRDEALSNSMELTEGKLPFIFEVHSPIADSIYIEIINGKERILLTDIFVGQDPTTARDTIRIDFPIYETYIVADIDGNKMDGYWVKRNKKIPFSARYGKSHRFTTLRKEPIMDISGLWPTIFGEGDDAFEAIGAFEQDENHVSGTFMMNTGDFRYLDGSIQDEKLYLSTFDGSHALLFEAKILNKKGMTGALYTGGGSKIAWRAHKDDTATLPDANSLVRIDNSEKVHFSLPNSDGQLVLPLAGKPKIIQIMGTWCPNCRDEGAFLAEYLRNHPDLPIQVIGMAFERYDDNNRNAQLVNTYKKNLKIPYDILLAGKPSKKNVLKIFPQLNNFMAYPTLIYVNRHDKIVQVHTGFNGPATPQYEHFEKEFDLEVEKLLQNSDSLD